MYNDTFLHHNRKCGVTPSVDFLELATPEHLRQSGLTCQCGCVPYIPLQTDRKTLFQVSTSVLTTYADIFMTEKSE